MLRLMLSADGSYIYLTGSRSELYHTIHGGIQTHEMGSNIMPKIHVEDDCVIVIEMITA